MRCGGVGCVQAWRGVVWCGVVWCGVVWCGVVWCGVVWCGVVWCGVVWCGVVWCGVVWCGVVWCGVVWCGVVWCGVVWCPEGGVTKRQWLGCLAHRKMQNGWALNLNPHTGRKPCSQGARCCALGRWLQVPCRPPSLRVGCLLGVVCQIHLGIHGWF